MELLASLKYWQWLCKLGMEDQVSIVFFFVRNGLLTV